MAVDTSDPALPQAAQDGDPAALEALLATHREIVFRYGLRFFRTTEDAEDAVQETLWGRSTFDWKISPSRRNYHVAVRHRSKYLPSVSATT